MKLFQGMQLIQKLQDDQKSMKKAFEDVSGSIASLLLRGGKTAHSMFVIPLELLENSTWGIKQNTHLAELIVPGRMKDGEDEPVWIEIPKKFLINSSNSLIEQIVTKTYPNFIERQNDDAYL
ncbi:ATP-dependent DNA helicase PIF1-like protein [Tanacetum coccineum]